MRSMKYVAFSLLALVLGLGLEAACSDSSDGGSGGGGGSDAAGSDGKTNDDGSTSIDGASDGPITDANTDDAADAATDGATGPFLLRSTAFAAGGVIPAAQACNTNTSPPLSWSGAPAGTQSFAVVMRDLTLANATNYHWVIYDIPATETGLPQGVQAVASPPMPSGAKQTYWSFSANYSYLGPCPPMGGGFHDYQFTVYAFTTPTIAVPGGTTDPGAADAVIQAAKIDSATLTGKYQR
jgi:Raf kinase inhibitor-like YbhB/YbcL family protein